MVTTANCSRFSVLWKMCYFTLRGLLKLLYVCLFLSNCQTKPIRLFYKTYFWKQLDESMLKSWLSMASWADTPAELLPPRAKNGSMLLEAARIPCTPPKSTSSLVGCPSKAVVFGLWTPIRSIPLYSFILRKRR